MLMWYCVCALLENKLTTKNMYCYKKYNSPIYKLYNKVGNIKLYIRPNYYNFIPLFCFCLSIESSLVHLSEISRFVVFVFILSCEMIYIQKYLISCFLNNIIKKKLVERAKVGHGSL
jgi:hypothetical protein